jgi:hypothetical protein
MPSIIWERVDAWATTLGYGQLVIDATVSGGQVVVVRVTEKSQTWTLSAAENTKRSIE